jgi:hypothetical protein
MRKNILLIILSFFSIVAHSQRFYNKLGDEAMKVLNYRDAKIYYEEGVANCNMYSIDQLTSIWLADESMHLIMKNVMGRCLTCLLDRATEITADTASMKKLILYYDKGIGTSVNEATADFWRSQLEATKNAYRPGSYTYRQPKEKVKMDFFVGYSSSYYTPFGLTVGGVGKSIGWYLRFRTNMSFQNYDYEYNNGNVDGLNNYAYEYKSKDEVNSLIATGGMIFKTSKVFSISAGIGYCSRQTFYQYELINKEITKSEGLVWVKDTNKEFSYSGLAVDLDGIVRIGNIFYTSFGCTALNFKDLSGNIGLGVFF